MPAEAGIHAIIFIRFWIPAFAGMTNFVAFFTPVSRICMNSAAASLSAGFRRNDDLCNI
jgi:hypothetical protein